MTTQSATDAALRADIRHIGNLLGETLVRQEGQSLLDLVERVRQLARRDSAATAELLEQLPTADAVRLVRAFSTFFMLANVAEQVDRGRNFAAQRERGGGWLRHVCGEIEAALAVGLIERGDIADATSKLAVRPVFTAHPTEAARRSA
ncbi:MAG TPA: phosphoenolpyruvate carboxylase, partial [Mycobacteriales bacterium]|nr:phosphoenolpyruvate carboxylase [Mycobacteriales bacterium]